MKILVVFVPASNQAYARNRGNNSWNNHIVAIAYPIMKTITGYSDATAGNYALRIIKLYSHGYKWIQKRCQGKGYS